MPDTEPEWMFVVTVDQNSCGSIVEKQEVLGRTDYLLFFDTILTA
jgi:hypothetical protein